ncbi:MAG TPA: DUF1328 domain-containing protein [Burkholderiales bacterium]|nr:DUF1328 domain-containing protein [Burkholderiales bacterium]
MFFYALLFFIIAGVAALVGFNDVAPDLRVVGRLVFYGFLIGGFAFLLFGLSKR